ncbi:sorting nexin-14 isoform X3 [Hydra vulgaris]|uniref:Sorting nexin-14 isoform X3 n=1 Tax=Hydra vulgaris TaxID=6087 RepID=A0ABM4CCG7_HYDVU
MAETHDINQIGVLSIILLILCTLTMVRYTFLVFSVWSFTFGIGVAFFLLRNYKVIPNLLLLLELTGTVKEVAELKEVQNEKKGCGVCLKKDCSRHKPETTSQPTFLLESLKVPKPVDDAITEFLEIVLGTHVYSWYWDISRDQRLIDEIRIMIRHCAAVILNRVQKKNIPQFLLKNCLKKFMIHLDCFFTSKQKASPNDDMQTFVFENKKFYKHFCLQSEAAELQYLRYTIHAILPYLMPSKAADCRGSTYLIEEICSSIILKPLMEKMSEPDVVNHLLLIFLDKSTLPEPDYPLSEKVTFLESFGKSRSHHTNSALTLSLYDLMHNAAYLYPMMQFMKRENALNLLQFCLAVEEFNQRSLAMDLSESEKVKLLDEAKQIHLDYFDSKAVDKINFPDDIVKEFQDAILSPNDSMTQLRTASPLFRAFEFASDLLEKYYVPLFHKSDEFFYLICGDRSPKQKKVVESNIEKRKFMPLAELSKLANRIKAKKQVLKSDNIISSETEVPNEENYEAFSNSDDEFDDADDSDDETYDLSYWHVVVSHIDFVMKENKKSFVFVINIERVGNSNSSCADSQWHVYRNYSEFYVLDSKLKSFHESLSNEVELPPKRTILKKDFGYLNSIKSKLQEYLQRLVRSPVLRTSSLLHSFLTPGAEITGMFEPDSVGKEAGRKMKSLKSKLVTEKGQNLLPFLNAYVLTAEPPVKKKVMPKSSLIHQHQKLNSRPYLQIPQNMCSINPQNHLFYSSNDTEYPCGITNYIIYAAKNFLKVAPWIHHLLICAQYLCLNTLDAFVERYVTYKLSLVTAELQLVSYIHLIRDIIFFDNEPPRTDFDKVARRDQALVELLDFLPERLRSLIGIENYDQAIKIIFEMFQYPKLNKQLLYVLLDELLLEIFPELKIENIGKK